MNPVTVITLSTLRLECLTSIGNSVGTGFLFGFDCGNDRSAISIITNKHVIRDAQTMKVTFSLLPKGENDIQDNLLTPLVEHRTITMNNLQALKIDHYDPDIDLCAFNVSWLFNQLTENNSLRHTILNEKWLPDENQKSIFRSIEPIVMIGYPNGLWDRTNNLPIARSGLTGSHPLLNWNDRREFVIDAACFPGSSGSPVFHFQDGMYRANYNSYSPGTSICLLGILWGSPTISVQGVITQREVPTSMENIPVMNAMMNLGFAIRFDALGDIKAKILERIR